MSFGRLTVECEWLFRLEKNDGGSCLDAIATATLTKQTTINFRIIVKIIRTCCTKHISTNKKTFFLSRNIKHSIIKLSPVCEKALY